MASLFAVLVLAALVLLPTPTVPLLVPYPHLYEVVENAAHPLIFALIALLVLRVGRPWCRRAGQREAAAYAAALGVALLLGASTELLQLLEARDGSWEDLMNDGLGAGFALSVRACRDSSAGSRRRRGLIAAASVCLMLILLPLAWAGTAYLHRYESLPRLWQRHSVLDGYFSQENGPGYPGLHLAEPFADWSGYGTLQVVLVNRSPLPVRIMLRVHDRAHTLAFDDRYNEGFDLAAQSRQTLVVPLARIEHAPKGRLLDLRQIAGVIVFRSREDRDRDVAVEEIRLGH